MCALLESKRATLRLRLAGEASSGDIQNMYARGWSAIARQSEPSPTRMPKLHAVLTDGARVEEGATGSYIDQSCKPVPASRMAYDRAQAERLWHESMQLVGLPAEFSVLD